MTDKIKQLLESRRSRRDERVALATKTVNEVLQTVFAEMPKLRFVRLQGYTPSFNDGDPCTHSMRPPVVDVYDPDEMLYNFWKDRNTNGDVNLSLITGDRLNWSRSTFHKREGATNNWDGEWKPTPLPEDAHHRACIVALDLIYSLDEELHILYETNWQLDITRDDSSPLGFNISKTYLEPSY